MTPRIVFLALPLVVVLPVQAQQASQELGQPLRIVITKPDCSRLVRHVPDADVTYQPGIDARGRPVAPADVPGSGANALPGLVPEVLEIPLTIRPMEGKAYATHGTAQSEALLGTVRYDMGRDLFTFNGQPIGSELQQELARACAKRGVR
jgi:hypothetical protein